jgi:H+/gluconate symporter-like permease
MGEARSLRGEAEDCVPDRRVTWPAAGTAVDGCLGVREVHLHGLIPPHPGPLIAIAAVHAQLGTTLALGIVVAIPTVILCGPLLSILIAGVVPVGVPAYAGVDTTAAKSQHEDVKRPVHRSVSRWPRSSSRLC